MEQFTPEEIKRLKELADSMGAWSKVGKSVRSGVLWLSTGIVGAWIIWEQGLAKLPWFK